MIVRTMAMSLALVGAYFLLKGVPEAWPGLMRGCVAVLTLAAGVAIWTWRGASGANDEVSVRKPALLDYAAIGGGLLALECALLWWLFAAPLPLESAGLAIERFLKPEAAALRTVSSEGGATSGNWLWDEANRRPLPHRTNLKPGRRPEVFIRLTDPADAAGLLKGRVYVGAFALGYYNNSSWSSLPGRSVMLTAEVSGFTKIQTQGSGRVIEHEVFHAKDPKGVSPLTALQGVNEVKISPMERVDDGLQLLPEPEDPAGYRYVARSSGLQIEGLPDDGLLVGWPGARAELLATPDDPAYADLAGMARKAAGSGSTKEQLLRLQQYLRESFTYSLEISNPRDLEPLANFLFEEKRGHCELFATAGALMARALGIPSRVAYGWAGGTWYEAAGLFVFRANEAHAWTELWIEGHGWVIMDPTPRDRSEDRARVAPPDQKPPLEQAVEDFDSDEGDMLSHQRSKLPVYVALGSVGVALLVIMVRSRMRKQERHLPASAEGTSRKAGGYFHEWCGAAAACGYPWRRGWTLKQHLLGFGSRPEFADELVAYHYGIMYEGRNADPEIERRLASGIRRWRENFSGINHRLSNSDQRP